MFAKRSTKRAYLAVASLTVGALTLSALPAQAFSPRSEAGVSATTITTKFQPRCRPTLIM